MNIQSITDKALMFTGKYITGLEVMFCALIGWMWVSPVSPRILTIVLIALALAVTDIVVMTLQPYDELL